MCIRDRTFCSQLLLFLTPMRTKFPSASSLSFFLILFLISFIQILSTFLIQDLFYFLCQQIISEHPAYALSCDPAPCILLYPPIQVQLPHVEPYDHQIKYNFYCRMTVTAVSYTHLVSNRIFYRTYNLCSIILLI